jgi:ribosomal protein L23
VKVRDVRTVNYRGKARRSLMGRQAANRKIGRRPSFKKAFVKLAEGDQIEFYEAG